MLGQCRLWVHLYGKDPQSEKMIDQWDCADAWMPTVATENAQMIHQGNVATEQVRNILAGALQRPPLPQPDFKPQIVQKEDDDGKEIHPF